jgi:hypothetical protein
LSVTAGFVKHNLRQSVIPIICPMASRLGRRFRPHHKAGEEGTLPLNLLQMAMNTAVLGAHCLQTGNQNGCRCYVLPVPGIAFRAAELLA